PAAANRMAVARPMPLDAPEMMTVRTTDSLVTWMRGERLQASEQDPAVDQLADRRRLAQIAADEHPLQPAVAAVIAHREWPASVRGQVVVDDQEAALLHHHRVLHALQLCHQ